MHTHTHTPSDRVERKRESAREFELCTSASFHTQQQHQFFLVFSFKVSEQRIGMEKGKDYFLLQAIRNCTGNGQRATASAQGSPSGVNIIAYYSGERKDQGKPQKQKNQSQQIMR